MTSLSREEIEKIVEEKIKSLKTIYSSEELVTRKEFMELVKSLDKKFDAVDKRFEAIDKRFEDMQLQMDKRFEDMQLQMDKRFDKVFERFDELSLALGHDFEEFNSYWLQTFLVQQGYPKIYIRKRTFHDENYEVFADSKDVEIDLYNEDPLVIGEVTALARSIDKITTFLRKVRFIEKLHGKAKHKLFITYTIAEEIRKEAIKLLKEGDVTVIMLRKDKKA